VDFVKFKVATKNFLEILLKFPGLSCKHELILDFFRSSELKQLLWG